MTGTLFRPWKHHLRYSVIEPEEDAARLDTLDPVGRDRDDHHAHEHQRTQRREQAEREARAADDSTSDTKSALKCGKGMCD